MSKKKYLITGGAGFIGSNLSGRLIQLGHEVVIVDNLSTGKKTNIPNSYFGIHNKTYYSNENNTFQAPTAGAHPGMIFRIDLRPHPHPRTRPGLRSESLARDGLGARHGDAGAWLWFGGKSCECG